MSNCGSDSLNTTQSSPPTPMNSISHPLCPVHGDKNSLTQTERRACEVQSCREINIERVSE
ncbi:hypothetical protein E2C01_030696 [Portunus trituberculatus]|uniref:Uncharacterized protein n=1 Tax=Portunus trituberculatus TaxID=210409 RepID=A0A5B7EWG8_PORTR|nr:hypothetical protein [Portunus trituberculatus]